MCDYLGAWWPPQRLKRVKSKNQNKMKKTTTPLSRSDQQHRSLRAESVACALVGMIPANCATDPTRRLIFCEPSQNKLGR